jgi:hypothetical protein
VKQSFNEFWSLETSEISSETSQVLIRGIASWMVELDGTAEGGNIIRAWTRRKKVRVERKGENNALLVLEGNFLP